MVEQMAQKLRPLKISQMMRDKELREAKEQIRKGIMTQNMLHESNKPIVPTLPEPVPGQIMQPTSASRTVTPHGTVH